jgi:hypothetical protein
MRSCDAICDAVAAPRDASNMKLLEVHYRPRAAAAAAAATQRWQFVVIVECITFFDVFGQHKMAANDAVMLLHRGKTNPLFFFIPPLDKLSACGCITYATPKIIC